MEAYVSWEDDHRPINYDHARTVEEMHAALPWHERMVVIAEYPQKNAMFGGYFMTLWVFICKSRLVAPSS